MKDDIHIFPAVHSSYVLHLCLTRPQVVSIGCLGRHRLPAGHYFYAGSACGAGGLQARVGRHLRGDNKLHWHIDYLRAAAEVQEVFYTVADNAHVSALECKWSQALAQFPQALVAVPRFGSSDCRSGCAAHLIAFPHCADITGVRQALDRIAGAPLAHLHFP